MREFLVALNAGFTSIIEKGLVQCHLSKNSYRKSHSNGKRSMGQPTYSYYILYDLKTKCLKSIKKELFVEEHSAHKIVFRTLRKGFWLKFNCAVMLRRLALVSITAQHLHFDRLIEPFFITLIATTTMI